MSTPEALISAIRERLAAGHTKEEIKTETLSAGHSAEVFEAAYILATENSNTSLQVLPKSLDLWRFGLNFIKSQWKLVLGIGSLLGLIAVIDLLFQNQILTGNYLVVSSLAGLLSVFIYLTGFMVVLKLLSERNNIQTHDSVNNWVRKNFWPFIFVYALVTLITLGGYILFLVPGIIVSISLYFALYALVFDDLRGEAALTASRQLVKNRWWLIARKIVGVAFYSVLAVIVIAILGSILIVVATYYINEIATTLVFAFLGQLVSVAFAFLMAAAGAKLYLSLKESGSSLKIGNTTGYRFLGILGLLTFVGIMFAAYFFGANPDLYRDTLATETHLHNEVVKTVAQAYQLENKSFVGLCDVLKAETVAVEISECNAGEAAWALQYMNSGTNTCIDSTGFAKTVAVPLEERTKCLPL